MGMIDSQILSAITRLQQRNPEHSEALQLLTSNYIKELIGQIIVEESVAIQLQNQIFSSIYQRIDELTDPSDYYMWASKITTDSILTYIQTTGQMFTPLEQEIDSASFPFETYTQDTELLVPASILTDYEIQRMILEQINSLSIWHKVCVQYYYYENLSISEISAKVGISDAQVRTYLNDVRKVIQLYVSQRKTNDPAVYSLATLPLLLSIFVNGVNKLLVAGGVAGAAVTGTAIAGSSVGSTGTAIAGSSVGSTGTAIAGSSAGNVANASMAGNLLGAETAKTVGSNIVTKSVASKIIGSVGGKIAIGVLSAGIVGGSTVAIVHGIQQDNSSRTEKVYEVRTDGVYCNQSEVENGEIYLTIYFGEDETIHYYYTDVETPYYTVGMNSSEWGTYEMKDGKISGYFKGIAAEEKKTAFEGKIKKNSIVLDYTIDGNDYHYDFAFISGEQLIFAYDHIEENPTIDVTTEETGEADVTSPEAEVVEETVVEETTTAVKWMEKYYQVLSSWPNQTGITPTYCTLEYMDGDDVPELCIWFNDSYYTDYDIYTLIGEECVHVVEDSYSQYSITGRQGQDDFYYQESGIYMRGGSMMGTEYITGYQLVNGQLVRVMDYSASSDYDTSKFETYFSYLTPSGDWQTMTKDSVVWFSDLEEAKDFVSAYQIDPSRKCYFGNDTMYSYDEMLAVLKP